MLLHFLPGLIMFAITVAFVIIMFVPVTVFPQKNELINFYWVGFWMFLAMIAALAGGSNTLILLRYDAQSFANAILFSMVLCFVIFVMFGWFRLSATALWAGLRRLLSLWKQNKSML